MVSLPSRERGLKYQSLKQIPRKENVAPFTGAWIEMPAATPEHLNGPVAPFTGAWIEIPTLPDGRYELRRRSLHGSVD